jgi:hypothetical protein
LLLNRDNKEDSDEREKETTGYEHNLSLNELHIILEKVNNRKVPGTDILNVGLSKYGGHILNLNCHNYLTIWPNHQE